MHIACFVLLILAGRGPVAAPGFGEAVLQVPAQSEAEKAVRELERREKLDEGNTPEVRALLADGADPAAKDAEFGRTGLMWAIKLGRPASFRSLLGRGASVNSADKEGLTPLIYAVEQKDAAVKAEMISALLAKGADSTVRDTYGFTALRRATQNGDADSVTLILGKGGTADERDEQQLTLLMVAAAYGKRAVTEALLDRGANVNARDNSGRTPLIMAAQNGQIEVVKMLAEKGAHLDAEDQGGMTAMMHASVKRNRPPIPAFKTEDMNRAKVVELLKQLGAKK